MTFYSYYTIIIIIKGRRVIPMYKHHEDSIVKMTEYYRKNPEIIALFLVGSVATHTERPESDLDGVAVVSEEYYAKKVAAMGSMECVFGECTYEGGYFDIHFITKNQMQELVRSGSEPMRNLFSCAKPLFCDDEELIPLAEKITEYPQEGKEEKLKKYYCTFRQFYNYFWRMCKPEGYAKAHIADGMVYNLYRLILVENEILFPSFRKVELGVISAPDKPENIVEMCRRFLDTLNDDDCRAIVEAYESWTSYDYPKNGGVISNNFRDPYDW